MGERRLGGDIFVDKGLSQSGKLLEDYVMSVHRDGDNDVDISLSDRVIEVSKGNIAQWGAKTFAENPSEFTQAVKSYVQNHWSDYMVSHEADFVANYDVREVDDLKNFIPDYVNLFDSLEGVLMLNNRGTIKRKYLFDIHSEENLEVSSEVTYYSSPDGDDMEVMKSNLMHFSKPYNVEFRGEKFKIS